MSSEDDDGEEDEAATAAAAVHGANDRPERGARRARGQAARHDGRRRRRGWGKRNLTIPNPQLPPSTPTAMPPWQTAPRQPPPSPRRKTKAAKKKDVTTTGGKRRGKRRVTKKEDVRRRRRLPRHARGGRVGEFRGGRAELRLSGRRLAPTRGSKSLAPPEGARLRSKQGNITSFFAKR